MEFVVELLAEAVTSSVCWIWAIFRLPDTDDKMPPISVKPKGQ